MTHPNRSSTSHRVVIHVDMDAFYAAVEALDDPTLKGKPVIVGGAGRRAVVSTASYEARRFGVGSAMSMVEARDRCPQAVVVPPRMRRYMEVSRGVFSVLRSFTPLVEGLSLDEAFLDVTDSQSLFGDGRRIAQSIRDRIRSVSNLTASAGVATSKFVAKVASDFGKPDGLVVVEPGSEASFLAPLPVERMWGVGKVAAEKLRRGGWLTLGDLARTRPEELARRLGTSWGANVVQLAQGLDTRAVEPDRPAKSLGAEDTFEEDLFQREELVQALLRQAARVAARLTHEGLACGAIVVKLKLSDHTLLTRRATLPAAASDTLTLHRAACELLSKFELRGMGVRLTGLQAASLIARSAQQPTLFRDPGVERREKLESALHDVRAKFGDGSIVQALLTARARGGRSVV
ncbi:MAG: DNA polymerase IV [Polyangiaceae bacterium]